MAKKKRKAASPSPPAYRAALHARRKKIEDKAKAKQARLDAPKKPKVDDNIDEGSVEYVIKWVKETWPTEDYKRFIVALDKFPEYRKIPYRLVHWTVMLGKGIKSMNEIYELEIVRGIKLNVRGKPEEKPCD